MLGTVAEPIYAQWRKRRCSRGSSDDESKPLPEPIQVKRLAYEHRLKSKGEVEITFLLLHWAGLAYSIGKGVLSYLS